MKGSIKAIEGIYPVTVDDAVFLSGSNKKLSDFLKEFNQNNIDMKQIKFKTNNLFNKVNITGAGIGWWDSSQKFNPTADIGYTCFILSVNEGEIYSSSNSLGASLWGEKGVEYFDYIGKAVFTQTSGGKTFTIPKGVKYAVLIYRMSELELEMLNEGSIVQTYEKYIDNENAYEIQEFESNPKDHSVNVYKLDDDLRHEVLRNKTDLTSIAKTPLFIETYYDGGNQPIHIKAVDTVNFGGYRFWMAYTPYPFGQDSNENPCIVASNDGINWVTPNGLINPIDNQADIQLGGYNLTYWSDTHLLYVNNKLELYYRGGNVNNETFIIRRVSSNGIDWSEREIILQAEGNQTVCPTVIHDGERYLMWLFAKGQMLESTNGSAWSKIGDLEFINTTEKWHFDVIYKNGMYEMVQTGMYGETIEYLKSHDGMKWNKIKDIVKKDAIFYPKVDLYRPSFFMVDGYYNIFYTMNDNGYRLVGLSKGRNVSEAIVYGIDESYKKFMAKATRRPKYVQNRELYFDESTSKLYYPVKTGVTTTWKEIGLI